MNDLNKFTYNATPDIESKFGLKHSLAIYMRILDTTVVCVTPIEIITISEPSFV